MRSSVLNPSNPAETATSGLAARRSSGWFARWQPVRGLLARGSAAVLADQAVVSGTNFLTSVFIGRWCGKAELGRYSLAFSLVVVLLSLLQGLVMVPYTVFGNRIDGIERARYAGGSLIQAGLLALVASVGLLLGGGLNVAGIGPSQMAPVLFLLVAVFPMLMLREFARSCSIAHFRARRALSVDLAVSVMQLCGLSVFAATGRLTAGTAFALAGMACALSALSWLALRRDDFRFDRGHIGSAMKRNFSFGRWIFAGQLVGQIRSEFLLLWLVALVLGKDATGALAACMTIVMFSNPLMVGVSQVLTPRISAAFAQGGMKKLRSIVWSATWALILMMSLFCIAVALFGNLAIYWIFGNSYTGQGPTMTVLAVGLVFSAASLAAGNGLWALDRPQVNFYVSLCGLAANLVVSVALILPLGLLGVAFGMLAGNTVELSMRNTIFWRLSRG